MKRSNIKRIVLVGVILFITASCGNPVKILRKEVKKNGYIMFPQPIESSDLGTLIGGSPKFLSYISSSQTCFPDSNSAAKSLKKSDRVNLPAIAQKIETSGSINFDLLATLSSGNAPIKVGVGFSKVQSISLSFEDVSVEYMDLVLLSRYYNEQLDSTCKDFLDEFGFIVQALKVGKMKFEFKDEVGGNIELSATVVADILDIGVDVDWYVENQYTLVIDSPKYFGYQLGRLTKEDEGVSLYRASKVQANKFIFKKTSLF